VLQRETFGDFRGNDLIYFKNRKSVQTYWNDGTNTRSEFNKDQKHEY